MICSVFYFFKSYLISHFILYEVLAIEYKFWIANHFMAPKVSQLFLSVFCKLSPPERKTLQYLKSELNFAHLEGSSRL